MSFLKPGSPAYLLALLIALAFGGWQAYLYVDQQDRHAREEANLAAPVASLLSVLAEPPENWAYRRVTTRGRLTTVNSYLFARGVDGQDGAKVIAPILLEGAGKFIMADTGYIDWPPPRETIPTFDQVAPTDRTPQVTNYSGILLPAQEAGLLSPLPNLNARLWYISDVADMASTVSLPPVDPVLLHLDSPSTKGRKMVPFERGPGPDHAMIAGISFGLAMILALVYLVFDRRREDDGYS